MKIAVDIVLIPSYHVLNLSFEMNKQIVNAGGEKMIFDKNKCIPHISILMGVIDTDDLGLIVKDLKEEVKDLDKLFLSVDKLLITKTPLGDNNYDLDIIKTLELKKLHNMIFGKLMKYFSFDATIDMLVQDPLPEKITLSWINGHKDKQNYDNFRPHITLGVGGGAKLSLDNDSDFKCDKIGIYQLGNYCTCRKELAIIDINN